MTNVWEGTDYNIVSIEANSSVFELHANNDIAYEGSDNIHTLDVAYYVTIQRLPTNSYPETTDIYIDRMNYYSNVLTFSVSDDTLVSSLLPLINTQLSLNDAEFDSSPSSTPDKAGFTLKNI